jgi:prepilin signal peptidase PulO-like enzyme (type II secretory pathway)
LQLLVVVSCLVVIFWIDYETFLIPLSAALMIGLAGVAGDAWRVTQGTANLTDGAIIEGYSLLPAPLPGSVLAMVVTAAFLWLLRELFSRIYGQEAMGFGDVFLVAGIAANIGWSPLLGTFFFLSVMLGAVIGVTLRIPRAVRAYRWAKARAAKAALREPTDDVAASMSQTTANQAVVPTTSADNAEIVTERVEALSDESARVAVDSSAAGDIERDGRTDALIESVEVEATVASAEGAPFEGAPIEDSSDATVEPRSEGLSSTHALSTLRRVNAQTLAWPLARHAFRRSIPFGPMLAVGAIVTLLYGARLNESYLNWVNGIGKTTTNSARYEAQVPEGALRSWLETDTVATHIRRQSS